MSKSEVTRAFIIEKAAPIFNQKGYAGTSLNDMTQATNLTKGSIYGNFENKDAVALAAFEYNLEKVNAIIAGEMSQYESAREKLLVYGRIYTNYLNYPFPVGGCPVLNTAIEADDTHPELKSKATAAINSWKKKIMSILDIGIENKEFSKTIDTEQVALTILALIEGGIMISKVTGKTNYRSAIMKSLTEFINGIE